MNNICYSLYSETETETNDVVVLIHGLRSDSSTWIDVIQDLKSRFKILVYDQRGHGHTIDPESCDIFDDFVLSKMVEDLDSLIVGLNIERVHLIGHSFGARTALAYSGRYPTKVKSLIMEDMGVSEKTPTDERALRHIQEQALRSYLDYCPPYSCKEKALAHLRITINESEEQLESSIIYDQDEGTFVFNHRPHATLIYSYSCRSTDLTDDFLKIKIPILMIKGGLEGLTAVTMKEINWLKIIKPDMRLVVVRGAGHDIHDTHPIDFIRAVTEFYGEVT
jgi:pimeloyl-ACP methyl ester carboxylesterase